MRNDFYELYDFIPLKKIEERFFTKGEKIDCTIGELLENAEDMLKSCEKNLYNMLRSEELKERLSEKEYWKMIATAREGRDRNIYWVNELKKLNKDVIMTFNFRNKDGE